MKPTPAENLLKMAIGAELLYDWPTSDKRIREYATVRPPMETTDKG